MLYKHIKIRIPYKDEIALGSGKVDLLEAIIEAGSISAVAKSMKMPYKRAWDLVDTMNRSFKPPVDKMLSSLIVAVSLELSKPSKALTKLISRELNPVVTSK